MISKADVARMIEDFKDSVDRVPDAGAILIIADRLGDKADIQYSSNLATSSQIDILTAVINRIRGAQ